MAKTKKINYHQMDLKTLKLQLVEAKEKLSTLRLARFTKKEKDVHLQRKQRLQLARILTAIRQKELIKDNN
jgi:ribosomal protein L29